jgi:hypothetical protein
VEKYGAKRAPACFNKREIENMYHFPQEKEKAISGSEMGIL